MTTPDLGEESVEDKAVSPKACLYTNCGSQSGGSGASANAGREGEVVEEVAGDFLGEEECDKEGEREEAIDEEELDNSEKIKVKQVPKGPGPDELRKHNATHVPFRSWCPKCVSARGHLSPHSGGDDPIDATPMISFDYCFLRRGETKEQYRF